jgi:hypothetical protein
MKKISFLFCFFHWAGLQAFGQTDTLTAAPDTIWRSGGITSLNFTQVSLSQWAAGGENSVTGNALLSLFANMKNGKWVWDNAVDLAIGGTRTGDEEIRKTDDKIDLASKAGYEVAHNLFASFLVNFKTQFTEGFSYNGDQRTRISHIMTPGYLTGSLGLDWKPGPDLSVYLSPATFKTTIVNDPLLVDRGELSGEGIYGVDPGENIRNEFGASFTGKYTKKIMDNVVFKTKLELFSNYSEEPLHIDVNWETIISLKVNSYISALITTQLIYDHDIDVPRDDPEARPGPGTQFKESFGIGFAYKFDAYRTR